MFTGKVVSYCLPNCSGFIKTTDWGVLKFYWRILPIRMCESSVPFKLCITSNFSGYLYICVTFQSSVMYAVKYEKQDLKKIAHFMLNRLNYRILFRATLPHLYLNCGNKDVTLYYLNMHSLHYMITQSRTELK